VEDRLHSTPLNAADDDWSCLLIFWNMRGNEGKAKIDWFPPIFLRMIRGKKMQGGY
jgi:hypothetical protein